MPYTEAPVAHHSRQPDNTSVLRTDIFGSWTGQEVEVEDTPESVVFQILFAITCLVDLDVHPVGVQQKHPMGTLGGAMINIDWMVSIEIGRFGNAVRISTPQRARVVICWQMQTVTMLSKSVQVWIFWQPGAELQILGFEDEIRSG